MPKHIYGNYNEALDVNPLLPDFVIKGIDKVNNWFGWNLPTGTSNCTLTATQWVDPRFPIANSRTITNSGWQYGYNEISADEATPGDLVIARNPEKDANHTMYITGYNPDGSLKVAYSTGSTDQSAYRERPLSEYIQLSGDKNGNYKKTNLKYYRYVSPEKDIETILPELIVTNKGNSIDSSRSRQLQSGRK